MLQMADLRVLTWIGFPYYHRTTSVDLDRTYVQMSHRMSYKTCFYTGGFVLSSLSRIVVSVTPPTLGI